MADSRKLIVEVVGDDSKLKRTLRDSETQTKRFAKNLEGATVGAAVAGRGGFAGSLGTSAALLKGGGLALGAGVAAQQFSNLAQQASNLNEQVSKSQQVFGDSSKAVEQWSKTTAKSMGISRTAALEATGTFGNLFATVGLAGPRSAEMSRALVQLAADLASFNNASPTDALDALRSGLIGEAEPLRRFGVLLSEARVQQQAMADTGKTTAKALTDQEKAVARYEIILKDSKKAQGDFARTSGGLANQQRILRARLADTQTELGQRFLPVMVKATEAANTFLSVFDQNVVSGPNVFSKKVADDILDAFGPGTLRRLLAQAKPSWDAALKDFSETLQPITLTVETPTPTPSFGQPGFKPSKAPAVPLGPSVELRNQIFDQGISRAVFRAQSDDPAKELAALRKIEVTIAARIAVTKDITRKLKLEDDLITVQRLQQSQREAIQANAQANLDRQRQARLDKQQAAEEKRLKAAQARATRIAQVTARQFKLLGLNAEGEQPTPGVANLKKRVASFADAVKGTFLDTDKTKTQLARFRKVLSESLVPKDVRAKLDELLRDLNAKLNANARKQGSLTRTKSLNSDRIIEGLGLSRDEARALKARLSRFNSAGVALAGAPTGAAGSFFVNTTVNIDGRKVATATTKHQQKRQQRNPVQTRGRNL